MADYVKRGEKEEIKIGWDIPPYKVVTVELGSAGNSKRAYTKIHRLCAANVTENAEEEDGRDSDKNPGAKAGSVMESQRKLSHTTLNPELDKFCTKSHARISCSGIKFPSKILSTHLAMIEKLKGQRDRILEAT